MCGGIWVESGCLGELLYLYVLVVLFVECVEYGVFYYGEFDGGGECVF